MPNSNVQSVSTSLCEQGTEIQQNSRFQYFELDCDPNLLGDFCSVKTLWDSRRKSGSIPSWDAFSIMDFDGWFPFMARSEVLESRDDVRFCYFGSGLVEWNGEDFTGQTFAEIAPIAYNVYLKKHWSTFLCRPQITISRSRALNRHDLEVYFNLMVLPLGDKDGPPTGALHFSQRI